MYIGREGGGDGHQTRFFFFSKDRKLLFYFLGKKYKGRRSGSGDAIVGNNNNNKVNDTRLLVARPTLPAPEHSHLFFGDARAPIFLFFRKKKFSVEIFL